MGICEVVSGSHTKKRGIFEISIFEAMGNDLLSTMKVPKKMTSKKSCCRDRFSFVVFLGGKNTRQASYSAANRGGSL